MKMVKVLSKEEINWHAEWPKFIGGGVKHLDEIKGKYWKYLSKEAKVYGKGKYKFEGWILLYNHSCVQPPVFAILTLSFFYPFFKIL